MAVDSIEAGRELDTLVAQKVMGWTRGPGKYEGEFWHDNRGWQTADVFTWWPSENIKDAWEVVEQISMLYQIKVGSDKTALAWWCEIGDGDWRSIGQPTAALAICKAALKCILSTQPKERDSDNS